MKDIVVRKCLPSDVESVRSLEELWAEEDITYGHVPTAIEELTGHFGPYFWVADRDGEVVGFVYGSVRVSEGLAVVPRGATYVEIEGLYVRPELRRRGIGSQLLRRLLHSAQMNNITRFTVYSSTKDLWRVLGFYEGHGFKTWYVQMFK